MHEVLVIDDDRSLTELLSEYLSQQAYKVSVENCPINGIERLRSHEFDVLLLDVMMPKMDGFEVLKELRKFSKIPVIMLTARGDDFDKVLGLELGADDYLAKPFNHRELLARIKALIRRLDPDGILAQSEVIVLHGISLNQGTQEASVDGSVIDMTGTEFLLLQQFFKSKGRLLSKDFLSENVLNRRLAAFDRSLDMHVSNLRKKLSDRGVENVIKTVRGNGYIMKNE